MLNTKNVIYFRFEVRGLKSNAGAAIWKTWVTEFHSIFRIPTILVETRPHFFS